MQQQKNIALLILAAGMGSRYGGLKQVDAVGPHGAAIIDYSIYDAIRAGFQKVVFVIRKDIEAAFREKISWKWEQKVEVAFAYQEPDLDLPPDLKAAPKREKPWGTAHAVLAAAEQINEPFAVINADDYYGISAFSDMAEFLREQAAPDHYCMIGYRLNKTLSDHGAVSRGICEMDRSAFLTHVKERHQIRREKGRILFQDNDRLGELPENSLVSMNFWGFHPAIFPVIRDGFQDFVRSHLDQPRSEYYIPLIINELVQEGRIRLSVISCNDQWYGVTYKEDKPIVEKAMKDLAVEGKYPPSLWDPA